MPPRVIPNPAERRVCKSGSNAVTIEANKVLSREIAGRLDPIRATRLNAQASKESSKWLMEPLPDGVAPHNETWRVMLRTAC